MILMMMHSIVLASLYDMNENFVIFVGATSFDKRLTAS